MTFLSSDPFQSVSDFFGSGVWTIALVLIQVFAAALWLALAYWVYQDARRRFENSGAITACVAIALIIPFLGALVYLFIRPPEYLTDAHDRELASLRQPCRRCSEPLEPHWQVCPYCAAPAAPTSSRTLDDTRIERRRRDDTNQDPEPGISGSNVPL